MLWNREKSCPYWDSISDPSAVQPVVNIVLERLQELKLALLWLILQFGSNYHYECCRLTVFDMFYVYVYVKYKLRLFYVK
jgi:hypothetical protein